VQCSRWKLPRLARNNRDWHHLIDLCVLTDTLVIDGDGIYDPRQLNHRLLLVSEFELDLLRQRMQEALRQKISRSEVLTKVQIGYVRTETNGIEKTPDRQVQEKAPLCSYQRDAHGQEVLLGLVGYNRILAIGRTRFTPVRLLPAYHPKVAPAIQPATARRRSNGLGR
jgi:DNA invertase Pin-like site-specific DNA recombinase